MSLKKISYFFEKTATAFARGVRFLTDDKPTESVFRTLFDAITFRSESSHRAKVDTDVFVDTNNGHVTLANDNQTDTRALQPTDRSIVVQPHQVPTLIGGTNVTLTKETTPEGRVNVTINSSGGGILANKEDAPINVDPVASQFLEDKLKAGEGLELILTEDPAGNYLTISTVAPTAAPIYYVNSSNAVDGNGSILNPFKTIKLALDRIDGISGGAKITNRVTIEVAAGSYTAVDYTLWRGVNYDFKPGVVINASESLFTSSDRNSATQGGEFYDTTYSHPNVYGEAIFNTSTNLIDIKQDTWPSTKVMTFSFASINRQSHIDSDPTIKIEDTGYTGVSGGRLRLDLIGNNRGVKGTISRNNLDLSKPSIFESVSDTNLYPTYNIYNVDFIDRQDSPTEETESAIKIIGANSCRFIDCSFNVKTDSYNSNMVYIEGAMAGLYFTNLKVFNGDSGGVTVFKVGATTNAGNQTFELDNVTYTHTESIGTSYTLFNFVSSPASKLQITNVFSNGGVKLNSNPISGAANIALLFDFDKGGSMVLGASRYAKATTVIP